MFKSLVILFVSADGQYKHICDALKDNKGKIDFSISVPNGTFHRKYIIIGQNYWELEYGIPSSPKVKTRRRRDLTDDILGDLGIKGDSESSSAAQSATSVALKNPFGRISKWLSGSYSAGFAVKYGASGDWTKTTVALIDADTSAIEWTLFPRNNNGLTPKGNSKKTKSKNVFGTFKPHIAYNTFSQQDKNNVVFVEQLAEPKNSRIQVYGIPEPEKPWANQSIDVAVVSPAIKKAMTALTIKGVFGVQRDGEDDKNGLIILSERCIQMPIPTYPCKGNLSYHYCITSEANSDPLGSGKMHCHPAKQKLLVNCAKEWPKEPPEGMKPEPEEESSEPNESAGRDGEQRSADGNGADGKNSSSGGGNGLLGSLPLIGKKDKDSSSWLIIVIIVIVIVAVIIAVLLVWFLCLNRKTTDTTDQSAGSAAVSTEPQMGTVRSQVGAKPVSAVGGKPDAPANAKADAPEKSPAPASRQGSKFEATKNKKTKNNNKKKKKKLRKESTKKWMKNKTIE
ncbi:unnamed protein product [Medioppia subpectinata]|uniref:Uncharacterized protein n=1 Tax=Medioppia subpectinata TaxID=1979941 RepID=A0A7R9KK40_9ACAR|nr:unnamed protein product [Medioppia subpectinata]CAG2105170.1 unnamed protein product [Medioppia subpectinata]